MRLKFTKFLVLLFISAILFLTAYTFYIQPNTVAHRASIEKELAKNIDGQKTALQQQVAIDWAIKGYADLQTQQRAVQLYILSAIALLLGANLAVSVLKIFDIFPSSSVIEYEEDFEEEPGISTESSEESLNDHVQEQPTRN
ncbi:hypothetical protein LCGC14_2792870 [marine sediment metagenome]|uniref:Uncharacterized protein n=1 Tax=marine sediment metagenome TaxID=412755 RepID=A0A0F8YQ51_9ZZZZ